MNAIRLLATLLALAAAAPAFGQGTPGAGPATVAKGGTGLAALDANKLIFGNGTSPVQLYGCTGFLVGTGTGAPPTCRSISGGESPGGYLKKFRNGAMDVWQRGTSSLAAATGGAYTADGWIVAQPGAAFTCAQDTGTGGALFSLKCVGGTSNTDTTISQRIESQVAAPLAGNTVTVQFRYKQDTGSAVTPKLSTCYATADDNFGTCTSDLASTSLTSCATATWCTESYTFPANASAGNGYQVFFDCNTALTAAQHCWITAADIRATPGLTSGINANPPSPELRPVGISLVECQRYLPVLSTAASNGTFGQGLVYGAGNAVVTIQFPVSARVPPTGLTVNSVSDFQVLNSGAAGVATTGVAWNGSSFNAAGITVTTAGGLTAGNATQMVASSANSRIIFTGAEL